MIQCKPPVTPWYNNLSLSGKRPVRIKLPLTQIQYLREVPGFHSAGHICKMKLDGTVTTYKSCASVIVLTLLNVVICSKSDSYSIMEKLGAYKILVNQHRE